MGADNNISQFFNGSLDEVRIYNRALTAQEVQDDRTIAGGADTTAPSVTINQAAGQADPTSASPINFTVTFSETVTGFTASDISFAGSTAGGTLTAAVTGTGPTYNVAVSGMTGRRQRGGERPGRGGDGCGGQREPCVDEHGQYRRVHISIRQRRRCIDQSRGHDADERGECVVDGAVQRERDGRGRLGLCPGDHGSGDWRDDHGRERQRKPVHGDGQYRDGQWDAGPEPGGQRYDPRYQRQSIGRHGPGNGNFTGQSYTIDKAQPTVTINQAAGQADPTNASPINFTVTFSETVTGFTASDISFAGSTAGGTLTAAVTGTGATYNVAVSGMTGAGNVVVSVPAGAATDAAGNASLVSTSTDNTVTYNASTPAAIAFVQANAVTPQTNQSTVTVAYTNAQIVGDTNILAIGWKGGGKGVNMKVIVGRAELAWVPRRGEPGGGAGECWCLQRSAHSCRRP